MIDRDAFKSAFGAICTRFGREWDQEQAKMTYAYLSALMDTDEFLTAARAVWAGNTFFPRPADFLTVRAASEWPLVLRCAEGFHPPDWPWAAVWRELSPRTQRACRRLGGMEAIRTAWTKDPTKLRTTFLAAFEEEATAEVLALPAPQPKRLPAA
jgi:hypothetical protein